MLSSLFTSLQSETYVRFHFRTLLKCQNGLRPFSEASDMKLGMQDTSLRHARQCSPTITYMYTRHKSMTIVYHDLCRTYDNQVSWMSEIFCFCRILYQWKSKIRNALWISFMEGPRNGNFQYDSDWKFIICVWTCFSNERTVRTTCRRKWIMKRILRHFSDLRHNGVYTAIFLHNKWAYARTSSGCVDVHIRLLPTPLPS